MLTSKNKKISLCLLFLMLLGVFTPFNKTFAANLTAEAIQETSAVLKATGLTPGKNVVIWVYNKDSTPVTPYYVKSHPFTVNTAGWAFSSFADLNPNGTYRAEVTSSTGTDASLAEFKTLKRSQKRITSFTTSSGIISMIGVINDNLYTISLTAPSGTNVTNLTPTITVSDFATVGPSGPQDFTNPITYVVTAEDGSIQNYVVTATTSPPVQPPTCVAPQVLDPNTNTCITPAVNTDTTYTLLAPLPFMGLDGTTPTIDTLYNKDTNPCPFGKYLNILIKIFLGIAGVLAVIMIVWGGIQYMTSELASTKEEGKKSITNAILGLLLALGAWLILNTINPDLLNVCLNNLPIAEITISGDTDVPITFNKNVLPGGIVCTGGQSNIPNIAQSFSGKMTYKMGAKGTPGPNNTIMLDCSGFVNYVLACANMSTFGGTASIFNGAETITSISGTKVNGKELALGDLLGWKAGENPNNSNHFINDYGHVMIYIGGGNIQAADSHGPEGVTGNALGIIPINTYKYKDAIKHIKRASSSTTQGEVFSSTTYFPSSKNVVITINNYNATVSHKVTIFNNGKNKTVNGITGITGIVHMNGTTANITIGLNNAEYTNLKSPPDANVSVWSAGIGLDTKTLTIGG